MKKFLYVLIVGVIGCFAIIQFTADKPSLCVANKEELIETFQGWVVEGIKEDDKRIKKYPIEVVDVSGIIEYNTIPDKLYDDLKNSSVCKATILINYTPDTDRETIEEITVRYQRTISNYDEYTKGLYIQMSGLDVLSMNEKAIKLFKKHNK